MYHEKTAHAAKGKWRGILLELGLPEACLRDRHGPCPLCGGSDRFRWDNKAGGGTYICNQCGAGDGMRLAMEFTGRTFQEVATRIDQIVGNMKPDAQAPKQDLTDDQRRAQLREVWAASVPVAEGDTVHRYLCSRGVGDKLYPAALRFARAARDGLGGVRPCMVAMVGVYGEKTEKGGPRYSSMHRTFLRSDGSGKADIEKPRQFMPGKLEPGACVALSEFKGGTLGIAEGIETAMAASALFNVPVWAALNATLLAKWVPPAGCDDVAIFGDNDPKFGGQHAAYALAHRLSVKGCAVTVSIPDLPGTDWNDVLLKRKA